MQAPSADVLGWAETELPRLVAAATAELMAVRQRDERRRGAVAMERLESSDMARSGRCEKDDELQRLQATTSIIKSIIIKRGGCRDHSLELVTWCAPTPRSRWCGMPRFVCCEGRMRHSSARQQKEAAF